MTAPLRVFMGLTETAGFYRGLKRGFEALGVDCFFADLSKNLFHYDGQDNPWTVRLARKAYHRYLEASVRGGVGKLVWFALHQLAQVPLFWHAVRNYQVLIFGFDATFFRHRELPLLRWLGKTVIFQYHGSDSRPPYVDGTYLHAANTDEASCHVHTLRRKATIRWVDEFASFVVDCPPQGLFRQKPFINFLKLGVPVRPPQVPALDDLEAGWQHTLTTPTVRILHSPSNPAVKGSERIREAIARLKAKGHAIDYVELTGVPNHVVLAELGRCDFVIDQLYADTGMAGFAVEAAWFGKPAIVGGYQAAQWRRYLGEENMPPTAYIDPENLDETVEAWLVDRAACVAMGRQARTYVESRWGPELVAKRYLAAINGEAPADWWIDPAGLDNGMGCGIAAADLQAFLAGYLQRFGPAALCLDDKPALREAVIGFAKQGAS